MNCDSCHHRSQSLFKNPSRNSPETAQQRLVPVVEMDAHFSSVLQLRCACSTCRAGAERSSPSTGAARVTIIGPEGTTGGKPWRLLKKGSLMIPVIRQRQGSSEWGTQHEVRLSAYCDLIEKCTGGDAPFGVTVVAECCRRSAPNRIACGNVRCLAPVFVFHLVAGKI